jgi:hypothetical protein
MLSAVSGSHERTYPAWNGTSPGHLPCTRMAYLHLPDALLPRHLACEPEIGVDCRLSKGMRTAGCRGRHIATQALASQRKHDNAQVGANSNSVGASRGTRSHPGGLGWPVDPVSTAPRVRRCSGVHTQLGDSEGLIDIGATFAGVSQGQSAATLAVSGA